MRSTKEYIALPLHGPLARYVQLRVPHAPEMPWPFTRHHGLAIPTCITARAWLTCRNACRDRQLVSFEVGGGENVLGIPGACATRNFTYLVRGPHSTMMCIYFYTLNRQIRIIADQLNSWCNHEVHADDDLALLLQFRAVRLFSQIYVHCTSLYAWIVVHCTPQHPNFIRRFTKRFVY